MEVGAILLVVLTAILVCTCSGNPVSRFNAVNDTLDGQKDKNIEHDTVHGDVEPLIHQTKTSKLPLNLISNKVASRTKSETIKHALTSHTRQYDGIASTRLLISRHSLTTKRQPMSSLTTKMFTKVTRPRKTTREKRTTKLTRGSTRSKRTSSKVSTTAVRPSRYPSSSMTTPQPHISSSNLPISTRLPTVHSTMFTTPYMPSPATATAKPSTGNRQIKHIVIILLAIFIVSLSILFVIVYRGGCTKSDRHRTKDSFPAYHELKNVHM